MSKTDSLLRLLAILRFSVPSNSSRTLNATQAYDVTSSGITLASAIGTLVDNSVAVKANADKVFNNISLSTTTAGGVVFPPGAPGAGKRATFIPTSTSATLSATPALRKLKRAADYRVVTTLDFGGTATGYRLSSGLSNKSKATNPNTFFYGAITVGTGDYKKWQGKYAVLKINTVTGKGVLRIYDDA